MARATSSLPVPLSPVISTGKVWSATRPMASYASCIPGQEPVEENNVRASGGDPFQAFCARLGDLNPVSGRWEHMAHSVAEQVRVVIDQEQGGHVTRARAQG